MRTSAWRGQRQGGFILITAALIVAGLLTLTQVGMTRSIVNLSATNLFVDRQKAFHLAEGGIDEALQASPTFTGWTNADTSPDCTTPPCWSRPATFDANRTIFVNNANGPSITITSTGSPSDRARRRLRVVAHANAGPFQPPAALTAVDDTTRIDPGDYSSTYNGMDYRFPSDSTLSVKVEGKDVLASGTPLPAMVMTSTPAYTEFMRERALGSYYTPGSPYGTHMEGDGSQPLGVPFGVGNISNDSVRYQDMSSSGLGNTMLNNLAAWAKGQAVSDGCYFDRTTDDSTLNTTVLPAGSTCPGGSTTCCVAESTVNCKVTLNNKTLGTLAAPKVCYAEAVFMKDNAGDPYYTFHGKNHDVAFLGNTTGYGVLVVRGEFDASQASSTINYHGLVIVVGPSGELDLGTSSVVNIEGAVYMGTTEQYCPVWPCSASQMKWRRTLLEVNPNSSGYVQYSSQAVQMANDLLISRGWVPPGGGGSPGAGVVVDAWWSP